MIFSKPYRIQPVILMLAFSSLTWYISRFMSSFWNKKIVNIAGNRTNTLEHTEKREVSGLTIGSFKSHVRKAIYHRFILMILLHYKWFITFIILRGWFWSWIISLILQILYKPSSICIGIIIGIFIIRMILQILYKLSSICIGCTIDLCDPSRTPCGTF